MLSDLLLEIIPGQLVDGVPDKVWLFVGAGIFFLGLLALILVVRARRPKAAANPDAGAPFAWDDPDPSRGSSMPDEPLETQPMDPSFGSPESAALAPESDPVATQVYNLRCPSCQTQFTVNGAKPILTNCPGCGKKGFLR